MRVSYSDFLRILVISGSSLAIGISTPLVQANTEIGHQAVRYDMRYSVTDDRLQVFDDGVNTRMLLNEGTQIPLVRTLKSNAEHLVPLQREAGTQFILIPGLHNKLILTWPGQRHLAVIYVGTNHQVVRSGGNVAYGQAPIAQSHGLAPAPTDPPAQVREPGVSGQLVSRLESIASPLAAAAGVVAQPKSKTGDTATNSPSAPEQWAIKATDGTLSRALLRWASVSNTQILYEAPQDLAAVNATYSGTFEEGLDALLKDTANGNYPLHGCAYANAIRVLHVSQPCGPAVQRAQ